MNTKCFLGIFCGKFVLWEMFFPTRMRRRGIVIAVLALIAGFASCKKEVVDVPVNGGSNQGSDIKPNLPETPFDYSVGASPSYSDNGQLALQIFQPNVNPVTDDGATLGRVLFYDKNLSKNNTISCASCHIQSTGFSDTAQLSKGFLGGRTAVHSMALANAKYRAFGKYFWNERANSLEEQVLMPIQDEVEMGITLDELEKKLSGLSYYPELFQKAFGNEGVNRERIAKALAQFVKSMNSYNSKYDEGRRFHRPDEDFSNFTNQENLGKRLFNDPVRTNCGGCHATDAMLMEEGRNNGLTGGEVPEEGKYATTGNPLDRGKFIAPSLRNIAIRPPYMHDGSITNLREVVRKYSEEIVWSPTLDRHLMEPGGMRAKKMNLSPEEIDAIVAFMETLTDYGFTTDPRFSDPFIK